MSSPSVSPARLNSMEALAGSLAARASLVARLLHRYAARHVNFDLNPASTGILRALMEQPRRITELAELEGQTQPYVTKLVSDLEARGWAARRRDPQDGRVVWVHITEAGRAAFADAAAAVRDMLIHELDQLSDEQLDRLAAANDALLLLADSLHQATNR